MLYKTVEIEEGAQVQFVGVDAFNWRAEWGRPSVGFIEADEVKDETAELPSQKMEVLPEQKDKIPKGAIFVVSIGEFEDYEVLAFCKALREIDPKELRRKYWEARREKGYSEATLEVFAWCEAQGYLERLPWRELSLEI